MTFAFTMMSKQQSIVSSLSSPLSVNIASIAATNLKPELFASYLPAEWFSKNIYSRQPSNRNDSFRQPLVSIK